MDMFNSRHQNRREANLAIAALAGLMAELIAFSSMGEGFAQTGSSFFWTLTFFAASAYSMLQLFLYAAEQHELHGWPCNF